MIKNSTFLGLFFLFSSLGLAADAPNQDSAHRSPSLSEWVKYSSSESFFTHSPASYFSTLNGGSNPKQPVCRRQDNYKMNQESARKNPKNSEWDAPQSSESFFTISPRAYLSSLNYGGIPKRSIHHQSFIIPMLYGKIYQYNLDNIIGLGEGFFAASDYPIWLDAKSHNQLYIKCFQVILGGSEQQFRKESADYSQLVQRISSKCEQLRDARISLMKARKVKGDEDWNRRFQASWEAFQCCRVSMRLDMKEMEVLRYRMNFLMTMINDIKVHINDLGKKNYGK